MTQDQQMTCIKVVYTFFIYSTIKHKDNLLEYAHTHIHIQYYYNHWIYFDASVH